MKGQVTTFDAPRGWGFVVNDEGEKFFFHVKNSPNFHITLGAFVEFETAPPFKLGQSDQAIALREAESVGKDGE